MTSRTPISLRLYAAAAGRAQREREKEAEGGEWPQEQMKMLKDVKVLTVNGGEDGESMARIRIVQPEQSLGRGYSATPTNLWKRGH